MGYPTNELPSTIHSVFYSYTLSVGNGTPIGSFEKFSVNFSRTAERIREIFYNHGPKTKEIVWAGTDIQVSIDHVELYEKSILQALGFTIYTIEDLNQALDITETMYVPASRTSTDAPTAPSAIRTIQYLGCVATSASKEVNVGSARIIESMTFECTTVIGSTE